MNETFDIEKFIEESAKRLDKKPTKKIKWQPVYQNDSVNTSTNKTGLEHINER